MADIGFEVTGLTALMQRLQALAANAPLAVAEGLAEQAEAVMTESKANYVPVDTGTLRASGYVEPPVILGQDVRVTLGYGGAAQAYALSVHENPRAGHTMGLSPSGRKYRHWAQVGEWKYLETPFLQMSDQAAGRIAAAVDRAVARVAP